MKKEVQMNCTSFIIIMSGRNGARTRDLPRVRRTLSQLSYAP